MRKKLRRKVHISGIPDAENHAAMKESIPYSGVWKGRFFGMSPIELCKLVRFARRTAVTCSCESYLWQVRRKFPKYPSWYLVVMMNVMLQDAVLPMEEVTPHGKYCGASPGE